MFEKMLLVCLLSLGLSEAMAAEQCWEESRCVRITGIGLGAVRSDDDRPLNVKQISAMRAARIDAIRSIAEQVKGVHLQSSSKAVMSGLTEDRVVTESEGLLKGLRFVRVEPIQPGLYQAVVELDIRD